MLRATYVLCRTAINSDLVWHLATQDAILNFDHNTHETRVGSSRSIETIDESSPKCPTIHENDHKRRKLSDVGLASVVINLFISA